MSSEPVHPLRIAKGTPGSSPAKSPNAAPQPRPLSELSPTERRRNSPSWNNQMSPTKKSTQNSGNDSSPFQNSPADSVTSPRVFWQNRNSENMYGNGSPSPTRRSSIERLQKASRVKNSNIKALEQKQEYDPTRVPQIERPLAKVQSTYGLPVGSPGPYYADGDKSIAAPAPMSPTKSDSGPSTPRGPSKDQASPTKSSLSPSKFKSSFDHETGTWSADASAVDGSPSGRPSHRHTKSVTFDNAPPQINEYEMATPDLSSIGTNSREGSYDSMDEDEEEDEDLLYDPNHMGGHDDESFDASLEDTDKTPVVGPDDWAKDNSLMNHEHEDYDGSPMPEGGLGGSSSGRLSIGSVAENRPLPPLPGSHVRSQSTGSVPSSPALSQDPEKMSGSHRSLPVPPPASATKSDIEDFISGKMSLEERLKLMMMSDDSSGKTAAEQQRERRLRRSSGRSRSSLSRDDTLNTADGHDSQIALDIHKDEEAEVHEEEDNLGDMSGLGDYQLPQPISRESIMKRVNGSKILSDPESEYNFSSPPGSPLRDQHFPLDPDVPIPSTEDSLLDDEDDEDDEEDGSYDDDEGDGPYDEDDPVESSVIIHPVIHEDDSELDMYDSEYDDEYDDESHFESDDDLDASGSHYGGDDSQSTESGLRTEPTEPTVEDPAKEPAKEPTKELVTELVKELVDEPAKEPAKESVEELSPPEHDISEEALTPRAVSPAETEDETRTEAESSMVSESALSVSDLSSDATPEATLDISSFDPSMLSGSELEPAALEFNRELPEATDSEGEHDVSPKVSTEILRNKTPEKLVPKPEYDGTGWGDDSYADRSEDRSETPDSVIHNPVSDEEEIVRKESPEIPERLATIKSSGSKLKTRISNTPSDIVAMREARRHVSGEIPSVPSIPSKHRALMSRDGIDAELSNDSFLARHPSFKNKSLTLDLDMGLSLDKDFERVIETQKRGYLMRQNTKLVSASDKDAEDPWKARSANNSPIKSSRPQSWTVEPWNSQTRRSIRKGQPILSPVPPLPGQESNSTALNKVVEEDYSVDAAGPDAGERGRLFVKVIGVKDLDLPIPKNERSWFSLTLDNGVHCVTTAWLELARNAPIGQEFELVVPNDLEFQLTLNVKLEKPTYSHVQPAAVKMTKPKSSTFSRVFASPKKRKELELRQRAEEERFALQQKEALAQKRKDAGSAYELLSPLAAEDGSFARAYISLKEHENRCFGRPYTVEVICFNEWATEEESFASTIKSKRGNAAGILRKAPYNIGKLELQLLFVPRPKNVTDDDMPKSMNSCIRELKAAEERLARNWEGVLSQQGGDCPYWRRRYFKLVGTKLTAYHEATRQPRATINLSNAKRLIDDRRTLMEKETTGKGGKRRRSAFAEEEEGYMFVEEGFRIRFNNGEVIDFYADSGEDKEGWMKALSDVIGRGDAGLEEDPSGPRSRAKWCELVFKHEEQIRRRTDSRRVHSRTRSTFN